ncbi:MAG: hypothetical protein FJ029_09740, partial [Actinobacteria bacterium]|nr:hypothetical protein [Actinomycetota bacterium]
MKNASSVSTRGISRRALLRAVSLGATGTGVGLLLMACGEKKEVEKVVATAAPTVAVATAAPTTAAATAAPTATAAVTTAAPVATTAAPVVTTAAAVATTPAAAPKMEPLKGGTVTIGGLVPFEPIFNLYR